MTKTARPTRLLPTCRSTVAGALCLLLVAATAGATDAQHPAAYRDDFEGPQTSWTVSAEGADVSQLTKTQQRGRRLAHTGVQAEEIQVGSARRGGTLYLAHSAPAALVFDELTASVWVRSNRPGLQLGVRIVLPRQIDPRTGKPLTADFWGETYTETQRWQQLHCRTTDVEVRKLLGRLRNQVLPALDTADLDTYGMSVDELVLRHVIEAGATEYALDTLELAPYIDPATNGAEIVLAGAEQEIIASITLGDGRLLRDGRPFFPVYTPYHGEPVEQLRRAGFNLVLVPRYDDVPLLKSLAEAGLGAMCEPPALQVHPPEETGDVAYNVGLPRFTSDTANILIWLLGTEMKPEALASVRAAASAVRDADPFHRPILVDVQGNVREFHRIVDVIGYSKHAMQTSLSPQDYLQFLQQESLSALRGKPTFTWIFTEPNPANLVNRHPSAIVPQLEPEQIWMQVYAALGAGANGIGYWTREPLSDDSAAGRERRLAITLANAQLYILRDWLATAKVHGMAQVRLGTTKPPGRPSFSQTLIGNYNRLLTSTGPADALDARVKAPILQCDAGFLILPQWLEADGQFQPGPMRAEDVHLQLTGLPDISQALRVTTTGVIAHDLEVQNVCGGPEITLQRLDQTAAIIIPTDPRMIDALQRDVLAVRGLAAQSWVELAAAKLERVVDRHDLLVTLELSPDDNRKLPPGASGDTQLSAARRWLQDARRRLEANDFDGARVASEEVLRLTRIVQQAHWEQAVRVVSTPVGSPYTICFETLPDFWRMTQGLSRAYGSGENLMRAGSFENWDSLLAADWKHHFLNAKDGVETLIELNPDGVQGRCLRLAARPVDPQDAPAILDQSPILFVSEPIPVESGQVVHIRGQVRIDAPVAAGRNGFMLYDNLSGSVGALRWMSQAPTGRWLPFELLRPVQSPGELRLTLDLSGFGDVRIDELQVTVLAPNDATALRR